MAPASSQRLSPKASECGFFCGALAAPFEFFECSPLPLNRAAWYFGKIPEDHNAPGISFDFLSGLDHNALGDFRLPSVPQTGFFVAAKARNKIMHALNGNTVIRLQDHIPNPRSQRITINLEQLLGQFEQKGPGESVYSRSRMLQYRCREKDSVVLPVFASTTTRAPTLPSPAPTPLSVSRTGRRYKYRNQQGNICFRKTRRPHLKGMVINEFTNSNTRRKPPPRGAPGPLRGDEEFYPTRVRTTAHAGGSARAQRRRAYRRWIRGCTKERVQKPGPSHPVPPKPKQAAHTRAQWFKNTLHWQDQLKRNRKRKSVNYPTTPPLPYGNKLKVGSLNVQGFADTLKLKNALQIMEEHHLDVLMLSETRTTSYYSYQSEKHLVILSGNQKDKYAGVGAIISPRLRPHLLDVIQDSTRLLHLVFKQRGGNMHIIGAYAPHSGLDYEEVRAPFWDNLEERIAKIPQPEPVYLVGDFNVRFQAQHKHDEGVTGPHTYGKGAKYIDHNAQSNRSLCIRTMQLLGMVEAASWVTPNPIHHITFKDKAAPPPDWSQFVLDPIPMQQVYSHIEHRLKDLDLALSISAAVRSYLDLPELLAPPKTTPQVDPVRFQRLDHLFVRKQWLNSVHQCRSKLYTGYPTDHYLVVSHIQVRLAAKPPKPPRAPQLDLRQPTEQQRQEYNAIFRELVQEQPPSPSIAPPDHNATAHYYTDGSGSSGRCHKHTAAGWGWCSLQEGEWVDAYGPVVTDQDHNAYRGATVGSNNTGEVTAIVEALLHAHQRAFHTVHIHTDSQWAKNVITGKWRAQRNKQLVGTAKQLTRIKPMKVVFHWVKAHRGNEGNERADALANKGREATQRMGTTAQPLEHTHNATPIREDAFTSVMKEAAKQTFHNAIRRPRKPWITDRTLELLQSARRAEAQGDPDAKHRRNVAKRSARKDRVNWVHEQLLDDPSAEHSAVWNAVKRQKIGFRGKKSHLIVGGKPVPWSQTHQAFRDHLQNKQWAVHPSSADRITMLEAQSPLRPQRPDEDPFTLEELQTVLNGLKLRKAPGPDHTANELFKLLDDDSTQLLLEFYNKIWEVEEVPEEWKEAIVVSIYKGKGVDTDPANYRPISLLNSIYKVFAAMLQKRLSLFHETNLRSTQYGFRPHRGTTQPLFILRRSMEWSEMTSNQLHYLFLDWKQAFDSLDHNAMLIALRRLGLSRKSLAVIQSIYEDPTFFTKGPDDHTAKGKVGAGIRQGCPLSPYLFIMVLTVIMEDVDRELATQGVARNTWSVARPTTDLEYADDTLLIARTKTQLVSLLHTLEKHAENHGMNLNTDKTELLIDPRQPPLKLKFRNGTEVQTTTQVKYLGSTITWEKPFEAAFRHRAAVAETAYKKLRLVWNSNLPRKTKLRIFQSVFIPTLIFGLDTLTLRDKQLARIDAYYFRFLRRVVNIKASYYSRISNHTVWRTANYPSKPSSFLYKAQQKLLEAVYATDLSEPLHNVVFTSVYKDRIISTGRRRGMKMPYWIEITTQRHYKNHWQVNPGKGILGPHQVYATINRDLKSSFERAPKRARQKRAGH